MGPSGVCSLSGLSGQMERQQCLDILVGEKILGGGVKDVVLYGISSKEKFERPPDFIFYSKNQSKPVDQSTKKFIETSISKYL